MNPLESYNIDADDREKALFAATHHHDTIEDRYSEGRNIVVNIGAVEKREITKTREYIKTVAHALGYTFSGEGPTRVVLKPKF